MPILRPDTIGMIAVHILKSGWGDDSNIFFPPKRNTYRLEMIADAVRIALEIDAEIAKQTEEP